MVVGDGLLSGCGVADAGTAGLTAPGGASSIGGGVRMPPRLPRIGCFPGRSGPSRLLGLVVGMGGPLIGLAGASAGCAK